MKYTVSVDVDRPREEVARLFQDDSARPKWQRGFLAAELLEGEAGRPGAKSKLVFRMGKRQMEMIETITVSEPPELFEATYDAKGVHNVVRTRLTELGPDKTRLEGENEFVFSGFMKLVGLLMKGAFPKQSLQYMNDFKALAEEGADVRDRSS